MKQFILLLALFATAYASSPCPIQKIKNCRCVYHANNDGDKDRSTTNYKCMSIGNNDLPGIVKTLQKLSITKFVVEYTAITKIPSEAFKGVNISQLKITKAPLLTDIHDDAFAGLSFLTGLSVTHTSITKVPNMKHVAHSLTQLILSNNDLLRKLRKEDFASLKSVTQLILSHNNISTTEDGLFQDMSNVTQLDMSNNFITELDDWWFPKNSSLTQLILSKNRISKISPTFFVNLTKSTPQVILSNNKLLTVSQKVFGRFTQLSMQFDLNNNPIVCNKELCWYSEASRTRNLLITGTCRMPRRYMTANLAYLKNVISCPKA